MTRDLTPTRQDLWHLVERYGSIAHLAAALDVTQEEMESWLDGTAAIPLEQYAAILALVAKLQNRN